MVTYTVHYGNLRTGQIISSLPVSSATFGDEMRGAGSFSATVPVGQALGGSLWQATRAGLIFWAVEWSGNGGRRIIAAGPVWSRTGDDSGIQYGGGNLFTMFSRRKLLDQGWTDAQVASSALTYSSLDLGSIIAAVVEQVSTLGPATLPISYEAPRAGVNTRTYNGFDVANVDSRISELGNVDAGTQGNGGPDWSFVPRFVGDLTTAVDYTRIEWALLTGTTSQPGVTQSGPALVLDRGAPMQQNIGTLSVVEDAGALATTIYDVGAGTDKAKVIASATDTSLTAVGYPRLDGDGTSNANDYATVSAYAAGILARRKRTPSAVTVQVRGSWWFDQGLTTGATVRLLDPKHPLFGPVDLTSRVQRWSGDVASEWLTLTLADSLAQV